MDRLPDNLPTKRDMHIPGEVGRRFRNEVGHRFRFDLGHSDLMSGTPGRGGKRSTAGRCAAPLLVRNDERGTDASRESVDATRTRDPTPEA
jgi:hypothetical protein